MDTQHVFGSGASKLQSHEDIVKFFDEVENAKGGIPDVIHLNDSKKGFNSKSIVTSVLPTVLSGEM